MELSFSKPFAEMRYHEFVYTTAPSIPFTHCFTTRLGGASEDYLDSLNLGENRGDKPQNVVENYRILREAMGIEGKPLCFTKQVHKTDVRVVTSEDAREPFDPFLYEADGIVSNEAGLSLICFSADCVPVLLCDPDAHVAGAIHCGWRSTVADILGAAVGKMEELGAKRENICAAIGPGIELCCFETGPEVAEGVKQLLGAPEIYEGTFFEVPGTGKYMVDLKETDRRHLMQLGLQPDNISVSDECTCCSGDKYWSHRRTGNERGAQAALIVVG